MLTRTSDGATTTFLWDSEDRIRDLTREGQLPGSPRDSEVMFRRDDGAWGETLPGGFDNVPGGMPYAFVGALGVRTDADSGMLYMRQRWYDPLLQRFISRDQLHSQNRYDYAAASPTVLVDINGRQPILPPDLETDPNQFEGIPHVRRRPVQPSDANDILAQYLYCYELTIYEWGSVSRPYSPWPGPIDNWTFIFHPFSPGGCGDWQQKILSCLRRIPINQRRWRVAGIDINTPFGLNPGFERHAIIVGPESGVNPDNAVILDPWITGRPSNYKLDPCLKELGGSLKANPVFEHRTEWNARK